MKVNAARVTGESFQDQLRRLYNTYQSQCLEGYKLDQQIHTNLRGLLATMKPSKQEPEPLKNPQYYAAQILQNLREAQADLLEIMELLGPETTSPVASQEESPAEQPQEPESLPVVSAKEKSGYTSAELRSRDGTVHPAVLNVLSSLQIDTVKNHVKIAGGQLPRPVYEAVNEILSDLGGTWKSGRTKAHVFDRNPIEEIQYILQTGKFISDKMLGFFPTPQALCKRLCEAAQVQKGHHVLEPSAGTGAIAKVAWDLGASVTCVEIEQRRAIVLKAYGFDVVVTDFLKYSSDKQFDRVVMNPPFGDLQDIDHVLHAYSLVKPGGKLASVMSGSVQLSQTKKAVAFRKLVESCAGSITALPDGSFKDAGTAVQTVMAVLEKPKSSKQMMLLSEMEARD